MPVTMTSAVRIGPKRESVPPTQALFSLTALSPADFHLAGAYLQGHSSDCQLVCSTSIMTIASGILSCRVPEVSAVMLLRRVQRVMSGGAFVGMSEHAAPSSFLHSYGVFEVLIYALRALLLHAKGGGAGTGGAGEVAASLEADVESLWPLLSFSGDILARRLPAARRIVEAAAARVDNWQQTGGVVAVSVGADGEADSTTGVSALSKLVQFGRARASERPRLPLPTAAVGLPGSLRISSGHLMPIIGLSTA